MPAFDISEPGLWPRMFGCADELTVQRSNPNFGQLYDRIIDWHLEIDPANGKPLREAGLDAGRQVVFIGPWDDSRGFIVDSPVHLRSK